MISNPYSLNLAVKDLSDTQLAIHQAYLRAYCQSQKVSVRQVCLETPMARSTFYTYYRDLGDLKREIEESTIALLLAESQVYHQKNQIKSGFVKQALTFIKQHQAVFDAFLISKPNQDFISLWKAAIKSNFYPLFKEAKENTDLLLEVFAASVVASMTYYLSQPNEPLELEQFEAIILKILPEN